jgi:PIN domain nuclease of toxin-antitoxin system
MGFEFFNLSPIDAIESFRLPHKENHKDPFDRMLIYLAIKYSYTLVTCDSKAKFYKSDGLKYLW